MAYFWPVKNEGNATEGLLFNKGYEGKNRTSLASRCHLLRNGCSCHGTMRGTALEGHIRMAERKTKGTWVLKKHTEVLD